MKILVITAVETGELLTAVAEGAPCAPLLDGLRVRHSWFTSWGHLIAEEIGIQDGLVWKPEVRIA